MNTASPRAGAWPAPQVGPDLRGASVRSQGTGHRGPSSLRVNQHPDSSDSKAPNISAEHVGACNTRRWTRAQRAQQWPHPGCSKARGKGLGWAGLEGQGLWVPSRGAWARGAPLVPRHCSPPLRLLSPHLPSGLHLVPTPRTPGCQALSSTAQPPSPLARKLMIHACSMGGWGDEPPEAVARAGLCRGAGSGRGSSAAHTVPALQAKGTLCACHTKGLGPGTSCRARYRLTEWGWWQPGAPGTVGAWGLRRH